MSTTSKPSYEPIPDVEEAVRGGSAETNFTTLQEFLNEEQLDVIQSIDKVIDSAAIDLSIPDVSPDELASNGQEYITSIISPTIMAVCTSIAAIVIGITAKLEDGLSNVTEFIVEIFPYVNALLVFYSSINPLQTRCMDAITPVYDCIDKLESKLKTAVHTLGTYTDELIDSLQIKVQKMLEPMKPTLAIASANEATLKKIDPKIDIPDTADIDREFDEAQGMVTDKIDQIYDSLEFDLYVPTYLKSKDNFYWMIIFPIIILALLIQMSITMTTTYIETHPNTTHNNYNNVSKIVNNNNIRFLLEIPTDFNASSFNFDDYHDQYDNVTEDLKQQYNTKTDELKQQYSNITDEVQNQYSNMKDDIKHQYNNITNEFQNQYSNMKDEFKNQYDNITNEFKHELDEQYNEYHVYVENEITNAKVIIKNLLIQIVISYVIALLQIAFIYIITDKRIKAWIFGKIRQKVSNETSRALKQLGVDEVLNDVLVVRMGHVRERTIRIIKAYNRLEKVVNTFKQTETGQEVFNELSGQSNDIIDKLSDKVNKAKKFFTGDKKK